MVMKFTRLQMMGHVIDDKDFAEWYVEDFMRKHITDSYFTIFDDSKREMTINGRRYARGFGFTDPEHQAHFVTLMWQIGPNFFSFPGFREILTNPALTEAEKFNRIYDLPKDQAIVPIMNRDSNWWWPHMVPVDKRHLLPPLENHTYG